MLRIISCKNEGEVYKIIHEQKKIENKKENKSSFGSVQECELESTIAESENISIFGDKSVFLIKIKIGNRNVINEEDEKFLTQNFFAHLENSPHLFFLQGYGASFVKECENILKENKSFKNIKLIKIEEKEKNDFPAGLVEALQKHDRKNSWSLLLKELEAKDAEPIHGSCIFAYKTLLAYLNDIKKNSPTSGVKDYTFQQAKRNAIIGKREREEVSEKYFNLVLAYHKARMGELDLVKQLEKWVLEN